MCLFKVNKLFVKVRTIYLLGLGSYYRLRSRGSGLMTIFIPSSLFPFIPSWVCIWLGAFRVTPSTPHLETKLLGKAYKQYSTASQTKNNIKNNKYQKQFKEALTLTPYIVALLITVLIVAGSIGSETVLAQNVNTTATNTTTTLIPAETITRTKAATSPTPTIPETSPPPAGLKVKAERKKKGFWEELWEKYLKCLEVITIHLQGY